MSENGTKNIFWRAIDSIRGDKVVWIVVIGLLMYSFLAIFGASSRLTFMEDGPDSRIDILLRHLKFTAIGLALIVVIYKFIGTGFIRRVAQFCFAGSAVLLLLLLFKGDKVNDAIRTWHGIQVYEYVKVAMILYLAWASDAYKNGNFWIANWLGKKKGFKFMKKPIVQRFFYIYCPMLFVFLCEIAGGFSSAIFIGCIMLATVIAGGLPMRNILFTALLACALALGSFGIYKASDGKIMKLRWATVEQRWHNFWHPVDISSLTPGSREWNEYVAAHAQEEGAKLAIKEGGLIGKGPGKSRRQYTVPLIFSDFMFSFIVEEYGLLGGAIPLIILYISLLARGAIIARNCRGNFAPPVVAGICLLISAQAFWHMAINVHIVPTTGQTLPLISIGYNSFLAFCGAFGILLRISRDVKKNIEREEKMLKASPIVEYGEKSDEVLNSLNDLDQFDSTPQFKVAEEETESKENV